MREVSWKTEANRCQRLFIAILAAMVAAGCSKRTPAHPGASIVVYDSKGSVCATGGVLPEVHEVKGLVRLTMTPNSFGYRAGPSGEDFNCSVKWTHLNTLGKTDRFRFEITTGAPPGTPVEKFVEMRDEPVELVSEGGYRIMLELGEPDIAFEDGLPPSKPVAESPSQLASSTCPILSRTKQRRARYPF